MFDYIVGLVVVALVLLVPGIGRAAMRVLAVTAIAAVAVVAFGLPMWAIIEAEPWLDPPRAVVVDLPPETETTEQLDVLSKQREVERRRLEEERRRHADEQREREAEQLRLAGIAETARSILERERKYARVISSSPRLSGIDLVSGDLIGIRIPGWRNRKLAAREKGMIVLWLHAIGLTPEETAGIHTAKGWGSMYDLWSAENPTVAEKPAQDVRTQVSPVPEQFPSSKPKPELGSGSVPTVASTPTHEVMPDIRRTLSVRNTVAPWPEPNRELTVPRRPAPIRRPAPEPEVGPFGY